MKVFYNSKIAKSILFPGYSTVMLFGMVFTKRSSLAKKTLMHERTHAEQFIDCVMMGAAISLTIISLLAIFGVWEWWMLTMLLLSPLLFYILYLLEYLWWMFIYFSPTKAYRAIGFERQANEVSSKERFYYTSFSWWR